MGKKGPSWPQGTYADPLAGTYVKPNAALYEHPAATREMGVPSLSIRGEGRTRGARPARGTPRDSPAYQAWHVGKGVCWTMGGLSRSQGKAATTGQPGRRTQRTRR